MLSIFENIFVTFLVFHFAISSASEDANLIVSTSKGDVKGIKELSLEGKDFYSFLGIPFAKPPVGRLRFKDPVEADPWKGVLRASNYSDGCLQYSFAAHIVPQDPTGSEDCLYLNVFTRNPKDENPKAVMVFIHGGGFFSGYSANYQPYLLLDEEIVLVVIQYRLSVFGFLSTDDEVMPGNYGLKDQTLALKWVQQNIANFGGDPNHVTIFGNSAGGASSHFHMLSPWSKGLFNKAIIQSGTANSVWTINKNWRTTAEEYGKIIGCQLEEDSHKYEACITNKDALELLKATLHFAKWTFFPVSFTPRIDRDFIPDDPTVLIKNGRYHKTDFIVGQVKDEGVIFIYLMSLNEEHFTNLKDNFEEFGPIAMGIQNELRKKEIAFKAKEWYLPGKEISKEYYSELIKLLSDSAITVPTDILLQLSARDPEINVYQYEFHHRGQQSYGDPFNVEGAENWVCHVDECIYLFQGGYKFPTKFTDPQDMKVKQILTKTWANFASTGNPTPDDSLGFKWEKLKPSNMSYLKITTNPTNEPYNKQKMMDFWLSLPLQQNIHLSNILRIKEEL